MLPPLIASNYSSGTRDGNNCRTVTGATPITMHRRRYKDPNRIRPLRLRTKYRPKGRVLHSVDCEAVRAVRITGMVGIDKDATMSGWVDNPSLIPLFKCEYAVNGSDAVLFTDGDRYWANFSLYAWTRVIWRRPNKVETLTSGTTSYMVPSRAQIQKAIQEWADDE